jgi:glycosyltransferase involved in cell wall biosynthesis
VDVSVITTTYNGLPFLTEAIGSVLDQTYADFEYILVDDGSTDATPEAVAAFVDSRLRYIRCDRIGRAAALNRALAEAAGQYVANLDADDLMLPGRLVAQKAFLDDRPVVGMVGSAYYLGYPDGSQQSMEFPLSDAELRRRLFIGYPFIHSAVMYRRESLVAAGGFDQSLPCAIDYDACARVALAANLANLPDFLAIRRVHGENYFMRQVSPVQYLSAFSRIKWHYWNASGRPVSALPLLVGSLVSGGVRKWLQR